MVVTYIGYIFFPCPNLIHVAKSNPYFMLFNKLSIFKRYIYITKKQHLAFTLNTVFQLFNLKF